jgi:peptidoglycan/LPS O-acetylase OafA/YrhL
MAVVVGLLYLVRRSIPQAGLLLDVGRANALYGMVCTAFAVLLAFLMFVGFQTSTRAEARRSWRPSPSRAKSPQAASDQMKSENPTLRSLCTPSGRPVPA